MATKSIDVVLPVLKDRGGDLSKEWYIEFYCFDERKNELVRYRKTYDINRLDTVGARMTLAHRMMAKLVADLQDGWRPWKKNNIIYRDTLQYEAIANITGRKRMDDNQVLRLMNEFLQHKKRELKPKSYVNYVSKLRRFETYLKNLEGDHFSIGQINNELITKFYVHLIEVQKLDKLTIDKYTNVFNQWFKYLINKEIVDKSPLYNIPKAPKLKDDAARPINRVDLKIMLNELKRIDPQLYLASLFQFYIAIRPGNELRNLRVRDLDFGNNMVVVTDEFSKTKRRTIDMPQALVDVCREYLIDKYDKDLYVFGKFGCPGTLVLGVNTLRNRFNKVRDRLNMPSTYKFYSMKHTGGGMLLESGASIEELRAHMGHSSIESTDHYIRRHFGERNKRIIHNFPKPD